MLVQNSGNASSFKRAVSVALASLLALSFGPVRAAPDESGAALPASALFVESDPAGATVFVDGQFTGQTPLRVTTLARGDHRVRLVKDGYLENGRVVTIGKDRAQNVQVKLTRRSSSSTPEAAAQVSGGGGGGSSKKKWIIIGAAAGGGGAAAAVVLTRNTAPVAGSITVTPTGAPMAGVTPVAFSSNASDPDNNSLTFDWNFGDGTPNGSGANTTHTYVATGTYNVTLSVSDGKATVSPAGVSVTVVRSMTGTWTGGSENGLGCGVNTALTQVAGTLTGTMVLTGSCNGNITITSGTVSPLTHPASVTWQSNNFTFTNSTGQLPGTFNVRFSGTTNGDGSSMTGTITTTSSALGSGVSNPTTFRR